MSKGCYQLIDFGEGRKLESLAGYLIDRPSPAAESVLRQLPERWSSADARYDSEAKHWQYRTPWPHSLLIDAGNFRMPVKPTPAGHIGLFPEQSDNWAWLARSGARRSASGVAGRPEALNLFAYTGASTMALVAAGYRVAHLDAAKPNVQAARRAAEINGWTRPAIRFLVDDAAKFTAREVRRKRRYDTIVLDPPAYGHGPGGRAWRLQRDLWPLLVDCLQLVELSGFRLLITGHSPEVDQSDVVRWFRSGLAAKSLPAHQRPDWPPASALRIEAGRSQLTDHSGRRLDAGFFVRLGSV